MPKNNLNYDSIQDDHLDALIRLAYKHADALETQEILEKDVHALTPAEEELCRRAYARFQQKTDAQERKARKQTSIGRWRKRASRLVGVAACLVLLLGVATPIAIAKVEFIRVQVLKLLINVQEKYTEFSLVEDREASFDVPAEWQGEYYPSYIPEGYTIDYIVPLFNEIIFVNAIEEKIMFYEYEMTEELNIDTENADISYNTVNGDVALVVVKDWISIIWSNGDKYFVIKTNLTMNETLKITNSLQRVAK